MRPASRPLDGWEGGPVRDARCIQLPVQFEPLAELMSGGLPAEKVREVLVMLYRCGFVDGGNAAMDEALRQAAEALGIAPRRRIQ